MNRVVFHTNTVKGGSKFLPLAVGMQGIMIPMFIGIYTGWPSWLTVFIMLAGGFLAVSLIVSKGKYSIDEAGITESTAPFWSLFTGKSKDRFFSWSAVKAYKLWSDLPKGSFNFEETEMKVILEIYFKETDYKIVFNNGKTPESRAEFAKFTETFLTKVGEINEAPLLADPRPSDPMVAGSELMHPVIERKKSFYEKPIAKVATILMIAVTLGLAYFLSLGYGSSKSVYKLFFVLLPGLAFMFWRTFLKSGRD